MVKVFLTQIMKVDQWPPASRKAVCSVSSSLEDMAT